MAIMRRIRRWWCGRQHDRANRFHSWEVVGEWGDLRCKRCGVVREAFRWPGESPAEHRKMMENAVNKYRAEGVI